MAADSYLFVESAAAVIWFVLRVARSRSSFGGLWHNGNRTSNTGVVEEVTGWYVQDAYLLHHVNHKYARGCSSCHAT